MSEDSDTPKASERVARQRSSLTPPRQPYFRVLNIACVVAFALVLLVLASKTITSRFLGRGTDIVWRCKNDPSWDPRRCDQLLADRNPPKPEEKRLDFRSWGGRSSQFKLNE